MKILNTIYSYKDKSPSFSSIPLVGYNTEPDVTKCLRRGENQGFVYFNTLFEMKVQRV